jgi:ABC-type transport system substrate-binding protein
VQLPFAAGNAAEQAAAVLLQNNLRIVNPNYQVEAIGLPAPLLQQALRERRAPLALLSWMPALPDAYYWMAPAFGGDIAAFQSLPWELQTRARGLLDRLQAASDAGAREQIYGALTRFYEENVPFLLLPRPATTVYQRRELTKWLINAADPLPYYYAYAMR